VSPSDPLLLANGVPLPRCGFGTAPMQGEVAERAVAEAIGAGYRLIDTAEHYENEEAVGRGLRAGGVDRDELFVTTKFDRQWHSEEGPSQAFDVSAWRLGLEVIDLLLIHWPNPDLDRYVEAWRGMIRLLEDGRVRAIGTSNFTPTHLGRLIEATGVTPHVNQIQLNPWVPREAERAFHERHGIITQSWGPLGQGWGHDDGQSLLEAPAVMTAAEAHERSPGQVLLRWHLQLGVCAIPKSQTPSRIRDNLDLDGFELSTNEMAAIGALDRSSEAMIDPDTRGH